MTDGQLDSERVAVEEGPNPQYLRYHEASAGDGRDSLTMSRTQAEELGYRACRRCFDGGHSRLLDVALVVSLVAVGLAVIRRALAVGEGGGAVAEGPTACPHCEYGHLFPVDVGELRCDSCGAEVTRDA